MRRRTVHYSGHVQGVGFRYTAQHLASRHNITGYVRNLPDGRVELVMEGPDTDMDGLMQDIEQHMGEYVRKVTVDPAPATGEFKGFAVRY